MEHRFREDENELPYLVNERRDDGRPSGYCGDYQNGIPKTRDQKLFEILKEMDLTPLERIILERKVMSFLDAKDCTGLRVEIGFGEHIFFFTRENEYITTTDEFEYIPEFRLKRIFKDSYTYHNYDRLLNDSRFQNLIKIKGHEFIKCTGGYVTKYNGADDEFTMEDKIDLGVLFKVGSKERMYKLDLDRMKLSEEYSEFNL